MNIDAAASKLDGLVLEPGELFSFNAVVGDRSEENGFQKSWEINKGEMVEGVGGGTCQVASTFYAAAFFSGLDVLERLPHSRPSAYIPMGLDSTVVYPAVDLKVRNPHSFPVVVHAKTIGHPSTDMAQTRTTAILDYGEEVRAAMSINHNHAFGRKYQVAEFRFDGTEGAAHAKLGLLLDYPRGEPDELSIRAKGETEWAEVPLRGSWFPDAFVGRMANLQRFRAGEDAVLIASVEDAWTTMALVEAAFESSARPATPLRAHP